MSLYDDVDISFGLMNQCACDTKVHTECIKTVSAFLTGISEKDVDGYTWSGVGELYPSEYGVYLKTSCKGIAQLTRATIQDILMKAAVEGHTKSDAVEKCKKYLKDREVFTRAAIYSTMVLADLIFNGGSAGQLVSNCLNFKRQLHEKIFWQDLYLYRVRTNVFFSKSNLVPYNHPVICGGNTTEYTILEERLY